MESKNSVPCANLYPRYAMAAGTGMLNGQALSFLGLVPLEVPDDEFVNDVGLFDEKKSKAI
eukprot:gene20659-24762_t